MRRPKVADDSRVMSPISRPPRRTGMHWTRDRSFAADRVRVGLDRLASRQQPGEQRALDLVDDRSDEILRIAGLAR